MKFRPNLPSFTSRDGQIMAATMIPMSVVLNFMIFEQEIFSSWSFFLQSFFVTLFCIGIGYFVYGLVAIFLRYRFPSETQNVQRIAISICTFILMTFIFMAVLLRGYEALNFLRYNYEESDYLECVATMAAMNIFLTFLNEAIYRFEKYSATTRETEQLKKEYLHSQLLGLKSQVNPHFLFNSLNTLSSLIHENPEEAEAFLDHLSKVYRYLLRNNEEQLVALGTELGFLQSYYFLLRARHNEGLQLALRVPESAMDMLIPPLTLQMLLENACNANVISRSEPLQIQLSVRDRYLEFANNILPRVNAAEETEALENIANKIRLLCGKEMLIDHTRHHREIRLPLIPATQMMAV